MAFLKHNSQKSDIIFNPICIPCFSESRFFRVQVFQGTGTGTRLVRYFQERIQRGGSKGSGPLPFFDTVKIVPSNSSTLLNLVQKTKESTKTMYQKHSLEAFQHYFKKDSKTWFLVRLIYSHSLLHNIKYYLHNIKYYL